MYPYGNFTVIAYCIIVTFAILKYQLLDIKVIVTRITVFAAVYGLILGVPFFLGYKLLGTGMWLVPATLMAVCATVGPFIYLYIQTQAENTLLQEQRRYQATLRQASTGMGRIKDLRQLVTLIVHIMTRTVRVKFSMVYLNDQHSKIFKLGAYRSRQIREKRPADIAYDAVIVQTLRETQNSIVYDEIKQRAKDYKDVKLIRLEAELRALDATLVVPSFVDEKLLAILVLGSKISGKNYSSDDLAVFSILANQSALAIENAQFYEDMKLTTAQLMKAEKMATIGIMADGLSHQINNRLHAMGFIAGDALDTLKIKNNLPMSLEVKEVMLDMEHALNRIESNVQQGGEIVQGLLKYTRKGEEGMTQVALDKLVAAALEMTQFKIKPGELIVNQDYSKDIPPIHGNFTQLQEVFFNLIDNAYDAMMQRKVELKEPGYAPTIKITAKAGSHRNLEIIFEDNGAGIKEEDKEKIFTPFFTTKLSSKKGTGLGLYVIQRLIEENHKGTVKYESKFKQGTKVHISLPT
jgi:signal transduction histidine kinase